MEYNLKDHGDYLERSYAVFIRSYFQTYEAVWKIFIGNKGNDIKGDIEGYPTDKNTKRQNFSEHTYTVLQSVILLHRLIEKGVFSKTTANTIEDTLNLQDNLLLFFTHLGRIMNNIEVASSLLHLKKTETSDLLKEFYHKRHILVHGKMLPVIFEKNGKVLLPVLSKNGADVTGWYHKEHSWSDVVQLPTLELNQTASTLFWELLPKLEEIFGQFKRTIEAELNKHGFKLKFEHTLYQDIQTRGSGSFITTASNSAVSVYGLDKIDRTKW